MGEAIRGESNRGAVRFDRSARSARGALIGGTMRWIGVRGALNRRTTRLPRWATTTTLVCSTYAR
jgi:hypothetical protein